MANLRDHYAKLYSIHGEAPDLLLKKISELNNTLESARQNTVKNQKAINFYEGILATMKYAWAYMEDFQWIFKAIQKLEQENNYLSERNRYLEEQLNNYRTIEKLKVNGEFDKTVKAVDEHLKGLTQNTFPNEQ